jgi:threonine aldolase
MILFCSDYQEGAHPAILEKLASINFTQYPGYGTDDLCLKAAELIREKCHCPDADIHFLVGGTQTNTTVISAALRPHQGVLCAHTGHINVHETGAIEATGHKVLAVYSPDGKITAEQVEREVTLQADFEHTVKPGMVYISFSSEMGTLYTLAELTALRKVCDKHRLYLFLDGARMGYGLCGEGNDVSLADIARLCDVFYIGGTKVGALFGEAVVIMNPALKPDFRYFIKQRGGLLAKGWLLGVQFLTLFQEDRYLSIAANAQRLAMAIRDALRRLNVPFLVESPTNQQFPILPDEVLKKLSDKYAFSFQEKTGENHTAVRICTSWATREEDVQALIKDLGNA